MRITSWTHFSKKYNSTQQPVNGQEYDVKLKQPTDILTPTFITESMSSDVNYIQAFGRYYWVTNVRYTTNTIREFDCQIDVLATYKSQILASTQYVSYSSNAAKTWLADTRIPLLRSTSMLFNNRAMTDVINNNGFYVLSATGKDGCHCYMMSITDLQRLIASISTWESDSISDITQSFPLDFSDVEHGLQSLTHMLVNTGVFGNAYADAPNNIRSCIWVPFAISAFSETSERLYLGQFDTGLNCFRVKTTPKNGTFSISIPWQHSDWRRGICEDVYLSLPFVGTVQLSADSLTHVDALYINYSATATDGVIAYEVHAGNSNHIIGIYQGQCSANYPIGISQQASAGQVLQSVINGTEKVASAAITGSISPLQLPATAAGVGAALLQSGYNIENTRFTSNNTTIGGTGGGATAGLSTQAQVLTVSHDTAITPSDMAATMGRPFMAPTSLANLTGYCQCANASLSIEGTEYERQTINAFLNSGFFIE